PTESEVGMILDHPLTAAQRAVSQKNYNLFSLVNGFSYMCLGETVLILLAVQIKCPDWVIAALGAMMYIGFLMLPWGRVVTARVGAAKAQANFWVARNFAALLVASAAVLYWRDCPGLAMAALLAGAFLFYGFRAAGVVMSQPLIAELTTDDDRGQILARSGGYFYGACFLALIVIAWVLRGRQDDPWILAEIIVVGAVLGCTASRFLARIDETAAPRDSARRPIREELRQVASSRVLRRQLLAGFAVNVSIITLVPVSMMALKKGFAIGDGEAMYFALCQFAACAAMSFVTGTISARIGPRKFLLVAYVALLLVGGLWQVVPAAYSGLAMAPLFLLAGAALVSMNNSNVHYFLQTIPEGLRVTASMFVSVFTGVGAGLAGTVLAKVLLAVGSHCHPDSLLEGYRLYFLLAALVALPGVWFIWRLDPLPVEQRPIPRDIFDSQYGNRVNYARSSERLFARPRKGSAIAPKDEAASDAAACAKEEP
ncbi:MAG: MFS transporter, partial [Planctomycetes bacterium]|nr:MFS transporter [Planctomycetota bacterium]